MAYVSVMLIGSVVIDNQSILTLLEAWLTVARDLLYYTEQFTNLLSMQDTSQR